MAPASFIRWCQRDGRAASLATRDAEVVPVGVRTRLASIAGTFGNDERPLRYAVKVTSSGTEITLSCDAVDNG